MVESNWQTDSTHPLLSFAFSFNLRPYMEAAARAQSQLTWPPSPLRPAWPPHPPAVVAAVPSPAPQAPGCAVMVEPRPHPLLEETVAHFTSKLPSWRVRLYHSSANEREARVLKKSFPELELRQEDQLSATEGGGGGAYTTLLLSHVFWLGGAVQVATSCSRLGSACFRA